MRFRTVVFALVALLAVGFLLSPVTVAYVTSDSMSPTIERGDLYFVVPSDGVEQGEVVTFYSPVKERYITHRVVGTSAAGYITKGDNNPQPDQAVTEPPVTPDRIRGELATVGGDPVVLRNLAGPFRWLQAQQLELAVLIAWLFVANRVRRSLDTRVRQRTSDRTLRAGTAVHGLALGVFLVCLTLVFVSGGTHAVGLQASADATGESGVTVPTGQSFTRELTYKPAPPPLFHTVVRADGATIRDHWVSDGARHVVVEAGPYSAAGTHRVQVTTKHYPLTLPPSVIEWLHGVHPLLAAIGTVAVLVVLFSLLARALVPSRAPVVFRRRRGRA